MQTFSGSWERPKVHRPGPPWQLLPCHPRKGHQLRQPIAFKTPVIRAVNSKGVWDTVVLAL